MLVKNGTAFIGGRFARADVRVENGKIAQIGDLQPREGEDVRSAAGLYVLPGFVDIHIHAYAGADCMRGENDVRRMSEGLMERLGGSFKSVMLINSGLLAAGIAGVITPQMSSLLHNASTVTLSMRNSKRYDV